MCKCRQEIPYSQLMCLSTVKGTVYSNGAKATWKVQPYLWMRLKPFSLWTIWTHSWLLLLLALLSWSLRGILSWLFWCGRLAFEAMIVARSPFLISLMCMAESSAGVLQFHLWLGTVFSLWSMAPKPSRVAELLLYSWQPVLILPTVCCTVYKPTSLIVGILPLGIIYSVLWAVS